MKPRVLFVSRERFRLPLEGAQQRKWDAVSNVVDVRVLAAAPDGWPTRDERFRLVGPARPRRLDGALYYLQLPWRIARELRDFRPDAALVQGVHETVAFLLARRLARSPSKVILDVQGDWHEATRLYGSRFRALLNPLNDALAPVAVRGADAVRTVSTHTTALVTGLGVLPAATFPSYVDADVFLARAPTSLPAAPQALFVGVLERVKGFDTLVEAWRRAAPLVPGALLQIVGDGGMRDRAERLVADLPEQTVWTRRLASEEVSQAMDASWLLALPSRSEGLPRVAIEAACRGRAIVGGNSAGIPDVVHADVNGLLVDPDDAADLAAGLVRVLSDRDYAQRLGTAARTTGEEWGITPEVYADKLLALVRSVLPR
jgi:glycosyltransferase involved in cell wall biosynthesis